MPDAKSRRLVAALPLIEQLLQSILSKAEHGDAVRLALTEDGPGLGRLGLCRYVTRHRVSASGNTRRHNVPWEWTQAYIGPQQRCNLHSVAEVQDPRSKSRLLRSNISNFMSCPVSTRPGHRSGTIFISWHGDHRPLQDSETAGLKQVCLRASRHIADILDLCSDGDVLEQSLAA